MDKIWKVKKSLTGGFEPPTFRLTAERSTDWATRASYLFGVLFDFVKRNCVETWKELFPKLIFNEKWLTDKIRIKDMRINKLP